MDSHFLRAGGAARPARPRLRRHHCLAGSAAPDSQQAGEFLARALPHSVDAEAGGSKEKLAHVLVFSDGLRVNGSDLRTELHNQTMTITTIAED